MVGLLALGARSGCEAALSEHLERLLAAGQLPEPETLRQHFLPARQYCRRSACATLILLTWRASSRRSATDATDPNRQPPATPALPHTP